MNTIGPLVFAHLGDLHITRAKEQNYIDYLSILAQLQTECSEQLDFVYIPGDIADNGIKEQYILVATGLKMLSIPVHSITGDHDMEQGNLNNFYNGLSADRLPKSVYVKGIKCIFMDVCGPGKGGPDFRFGEQQLTWLKNELVNPAERVILFMHTYPDDLVDATEKAALNELISTHNILLVDMGHTHYNDIANDGHTLFTATRSTGQIEEGPVGYTLITVDGDTVSWRFKPLADSFPFVMITNPADYRLKRDNTQPVSGQTEVKAVVFGNKALSEVVFKIGTEKWLPMNLAAGNNLWRATLDISASNPLSSITVQATDQTGRPGQHTIDISNTQSAAKIRVKDGSDADTIGAWPENGIFGTQLGPNRNGKPS